MFSLNLFERNNAQEQAFYEAMLSGFGVQSNGVSVSPYSTHCDFGLSSAGLADPKDAIYDIGNQALGAIDVGVNSDAYLRTQRSFYHGAFYATSYFYILAGGLGRSALYLTTGQDVGLNDWFMWQKETGAIDTGTLLAPLTMLDCMFRVIRKRVNNTGAFATANVSELYFIGKKIDF